MFPMKKKQPEAKPFDAESQGLDELKGFAEDGMVAEMMARLGLQAPGEEGEQMEGEEQNPPAVEDVPGMDASEEEKGEGAEALDPQKLKALLAAMASKQTA